MKLMMDKDTEIFTGVRIECKHCGLSRRFYHKDTERLICKNCGRWIYKDRYTELKYENKQQINKLKHMILF